MGARKHPLSGRITCAECGAKYKVTFDKQSIKSKGRLLQYTYRLLIHPNPKSCASIAKRIELDLIEEILKDEYEKTFPASGRTSLVSLPEPLDKGLSIVWPESNEERFATLIKSNACNLMERKHRQAMLKQAKKVYSCARQVVRDLKAPQAALSSIIDDLCVICLEADKLYWTLNPIERYIHAVAELIEHEEPRTQQALPERQYETHLKEIEKATISGKYFVKRRQESTTPRVLHLKFRGAKEISIPLDEE